MLRRGLLLGLSLLHAAAGVQFYKGLQTRHDFELLGLLKDGVVQRATMMHFAHKRCQAQAHELSFPFDYANVPDTTHEFVQAQLEPPNELTEFFGVTNCSTFVYLESGSKLEEHDKLTVTTPKELSDFFWSRQRRSGYEAVNDLSHGVRVQWEDTSNSRLHHVATISPGESASFDTFKGHTFVFTDSVSARFLARRVVGDERRLMLSSLFSERDNTEVLQRSQRAANVWRGRGASNVGRIRQNELQPPDTATFTKTGFKKMRVPADLWKLVQDFHLKGLHKYIKEKWHDDDVHVNFWESEPTVNQLPQELKEVVFATLRPILEEWSGLTGLIPTSCYGIRRYTNGSWLRDHVDIGKTHVLSAIANVDQVGLREDWQLQILDHNGARHYIKMEPGDLVLYESATCIHSRMTPLKGEGYYNFFTHFKPERWGESTGEPEEGDSDDEEAMVEEELYGAVDAIE